MNSVSHTRIMRSAFAGLPSALRSFLTALPDRAELIDIAGNYPDLFDDPSQPEEKKLAIDPHWARFCRFPADMEGPALHRWPHTIDEQPAWQPVVRHWLREAIDAYRTNDYAGFIKFIGCLSHYEGDVTQPAHVLGLTAGMTLMAELAPAPAHLPNFNYHCDLEAVSGHCEEPLPAPRLLGTSIEEAAWRLTAFNAQAVREMKRYIVPTLQAIFAGNHLEAERLAGPPMTLAARLTLDILCTALRLARDDIPPEERLALEQLDLRLWPADAESHDMVYGARAILDGSCRIPPYPGPVVPAVLRLEGGVRAVPALGVLPHGGLSGPCDTWMRYELPPGVFNRFEAVVGLHAELGREGAVEFIVELDDQPVWQSGRLSGNDNALPLKVLLGQAHTLTLRVIEANNRQTFWSNHALWGTPFICK